MTSSLPFAFGALLAGAVMIDYGVKHAGSAFASAGNTTDPLGAGAPVAASGDQAKVVQEAAAKHGVPEKILWGVFGLETSHGHNVATSSAGAEGDFQFIPGTAAQYHYPLTNTPNAQQFAEQADAAATYLASLFAHSHDWDAALRAYSGGGYGLAAVLGPRGQG